MTTAKTRFTPRKSIIGMVHVGALPGTPQNSTSVEIIAAQACEDAKVLAEAGFDAIIIENLHDRPYVAGPKLGPEIVASMTRIGLEVGAVTDLPIGVQILSCGNKHALAVAQAIGAQFVRVENYVFAHVADEGLLTEAEAGELLRYRRAIGAEDVMIFADLKKKHASHAITGDLDIGQTAVAAAFFRAEGVIVTGESTGEPTHPEDVAYVRDKFPHDRPVFVGSGVTPDKVPVLLEHADGLIVGSYLKENKDWSRPNDPRRAEEIMNAARDFRGF